MRRRREPPDDPTPSFEALYRREYERVRRYLLGACQGNAGQADDLTHAVFLEVWQRHAASLPTMPEQQAQGLLIATAKSRVKDQWRKNNKEVLVEEPAKVETRALNPAPSRRALSDRVLDNETLSEFWHALKHALTRGEFQVVHMTWVMEMSDAQIAAELSTTVKTVHQHRYTARRKIQNLVNRDRYHITFNEDVCGEDNSANDEGEQT